MKIDSKIANYEIAKNLSNTNSVMANEKQSPKGVTADQNETKPQDTIVQLSRASKETQLADKIISTTPDIRADKVAEIRERIESGKYEIDHEKIAAKMIDNDLEEIL
jgi:negative regulator of flagellin synthesis FlgM